MDLSATPFSIVHVPRNAPAETESVGTKDKFWFDRLPPDGGGKQEWLFKAVRKRRTGDLAGTFPDGDDWAERVSAEVASWLGLPHAVYELASYDSPDGPVPGIVTRRLNERDGPHDDRPVGRLVEGNELIVEWASTPDYPRRRAAGFSRTEAYTPLLALRTLDALDVRPYPAPHLPATVQTGSDLLLGYLMLDALVWNVDRHDQNWAVLERHGHPLILTPTYDHASSLGRELPDIRRARALDADLRAYRSRPSSRFHDADGSPVTPFTAFSLAARQKSTTALAWLTRLDRITPERVEQVLHRVPDDRISATARDFAARLLHLNRGDLVRFADTLR